MFVRRELFERVGFLDDRFFIYEEEIDWCLRARRAGYRLRVVPKSVIWHKGHRDSGRIGRPFILYLQTRNHLLMIRKNADAFVARGVPAFAYALAAAARGLLLSRGSWRHIRAIAEGWRDAMLGRFGRPAPYHR